MFLDKDFCVWSRSKGAALSVISIVMASSTVHASGLNQSRDNLPPPAWSTEVLGSVAPGSLIERGLPRASTPVSGADVWRLVEALPPTTAYRSGTPEQRAGVLPAVRGSLQQALAMTIAARALEAAAIKANLGSAHAAPARTDYIVTQFLQLTAEGQGMVIGDDTRLTSEQKLSLYEALKKQAAGQSAALTINWSYRLGEAGALLDSTHRQEGAAAPAFPVVRINFAVLPDSLEQFRAGIQSQLDSKQSALTRQRAASLLATQSIGPLPLEFRSKEVGDVELTQAYQDFRVRGLKVSNPIARVREISYAGADAPAFRVAMLERLSGDTEGKARRRNAIANTVSARLGSKAAYQDYLAAATLSASQLEKLGDIRPEEHAMLRCRESAQVGAMVACVRNQFSSAAAIARLTVDESVQSLEGSDALYAVFTRDQLERGGIARRDQPGKLVILESIADNPISVKQSRVSMDLREVSYSGEKAPELRARLLQLLRDAQQGLGPTPTGETIAELRRRAMSEIVQKLKAEFSEAIAAGALVIQERTRAVQDSDIPRAFQSEFNRTRPLPVFEVAAADGARTLTAMEAYAQSDLGFLPLADSRVRDAVIERIMLKREAAVVREQMRALLMRHMFIRSSNTKVSAHFCGATATLSDWPCLDASLEATLRALFPSRKYGADGAATSTSIENAGDLADISIETFNQVFDL